MRWLKLKESRVDFRWYSISEGELTNKFKKQVKENGLEKEFIFLLIFTSPYPFIKQCDIYCQQSRFEGFGMAIAEAKILNKPSVVTNFDIAYEQIKHNKNGILVNMNPKEIAIGIKKLINSELKEKIVNNLKIEELGTELEIDKLYRLIEK